MVAHLNPNTGEIEGWQEINKGLKEIEGWSGRVMKAILAPLENNLDQYPLGRGIPGKYNKAKVNYKDL